MLWWILVIRPLAWVIGMALWLVFVAPVKLAIHIHRARRYRAI